MIIVRLVRLPILANFMQIVRYVETSLFAYLTNCSVSRVLASPMETTGKCPQFREAIAYK
ncbi:hypothetical protein BEL07_19810 [Mycolicibacterium grossiae]|uniref:Uncharacterized protein n=1 Tax=Mycolicibacterium grossiae TaxID=1552759 RepID=A0A1E8Q0D4_9MYCO|nr:hypothetical protein BEL07_19810 [Mycolicibacterium grossiae]